MHLQIGVLRYFPTKRNINHNKKLLTSIHFVLVEIMLHMIEACKGTTLSFKIFPGRYWCVNIAKQRSKKSNQLQKHTLKVSRCRLQGVLMRPDYNNKNTVLTKKLSPVLASKFVLSVIAKLSNYMSQLSEKKLN